jgi:hypothetical protein
VSEALKTATLELANAYNIEGAAISSLTGNFNELLETLRKLGRQEVSNIFSGTDEAIEALTNYRDYVADGQSSAYQNPRTLATTSQFIFDPSYIYSGDFNTVGGDLGLINSHAVVEALTRLMSPDTMTEADKQLLEGL